LRPEVERYLMGLPWQGNVRQLENTCRWLTVMANGKEIHLADLPPELRDDGRQESKGEDWEESLAVWAERALARGEQAILESALPNFERIMIKVAIRATGGRRQDAARLLGWGRNTLTRKIKELDMEC
jgi:two-component system, NtrC family, nitrogen regulation response regulator GlnG